LKTLTVIFVVLIALLQYPLWLGKGSWLRVWDLNQQISKQKEKNDQLQERNKSMDAEVRDLKHGFAAIEERARTELGMVKQDEVFYQLVDPKDINSSNVTPAPVPPPENHVATNHNNATSIDPKNKSKNGK
jgi:cell division protein FtsB